MIADMVSAHPGFAGLTLLAGDDGSGDMVSLWMTREDAELASERSAAIRGPRPFEMIRDEIYEVDADEPGSAAGDEPAVALLGEFDGPMSPARVEAARFAGTQRIAPVLRAVPGLVRSLVDSAWLGAPRPHLNVIEELANLDGIVEQADRCASLGRCRWSCRLCSPA